MPPSIKKTRSQLFGTPRPATRRPVNQLRDVADPTTGEVTREWVRVGSRTVARGVYLRDLTEAAKALREVAPGFSASDGFDLRRPEAWTASQKGKVTRYAKELARLTSAPFQTVAPRSKADLDAAQAYAAHDPRYKFRVAFVPEVDPDQKVTITGEGEVELSLPGGATSGRVMFDKEALFDEGDLEGVIRDALARIPDNSVISLINGKNSFTPMGQDSQGRIVALPFIGTGSRAGAAKAVQNVLIYLASLYQRTITNWLQGIEWFHVPARQKEPGKKQSAIQRAAAVKSRYMEAREDAKAEQKRQRAKKRTYESSYADSTRRFSRQLSAARASGNEQQLFRSYQTILRSTLAESAPDLGFADALTDFLLRNSQ
jgi:hypothetical protein